MGWRRDYRHFDGTCADFLCAAARLFRPQVPCCRQCPRRRAVINVIASTKVSVLTLAMAIAWLYR